MNKNITQEEVNQMKYDDALSKLQEISTALENKLVPIDELTEKMKLANMLNAHCKKKLENTEKEIQKIIGNEAV